MNLDEKKYLEQYNEADYDKPSVAVDLLIFTIEDARLKIVLVRRDSYPFKGALALPGTFVQIDESADETVKRILKQKLSISKKIYFEQLYTWTDVDRDPRMRIISISYYALIPVKELSEILEGERKSSSLYAVSELNYDEMVFDHGKMIEYGRMRLQSKAEYANIAFQLLDDTFTLPELQSVTEILQDKKLYKTNFRKKVAELVEETGDIITGSAHRPSKLYRRKKY